MWWNDFLRVDFAPLLAAILSALCCCLPGNLLLARGQSMTTDAISHTVLPGMVAVFLINESIALMFWGALLAGLPAILLIEWLGRKQNRDAVLGMVFCVFFAAGILMLELFIDRRVHFDVQHILYGSLESVYWRGLGESDGQGFKRVLVQMPVALMYLLGLLVFLLVAFTGMHKEILAVNFDYKHAQIHWAGKMRATLLYYGLSAITIMTVVAVFRLVGLILIVGMFIIPPLIASFFAQRLSTRIQLSMVFATGLCIAGYISAVYIPLSIGAIDISLNIGGSIVTLGACVCFTIVLVKQIGRYKNVKNISRYQK